MDIEGLNNFINILENSVNNFDEEAEKTINRIGNKLLRKVKLKTPVAKEDGGTLRRSWTFNKVSKKEGIIQNPLHYAPHVEFGHRTRLGSGGKSENPKYKYKAKENGIAYIDGVYMLTKSIHEISNELGPELEIMVDDLWDE